MKHLIPLTACLSLLLAACGSPTPPPEPKVAPKVNEKTRVVTEETRKALSSFTFTNAAACKTSPDPIKNPNAIPAQCTAKLVFSKSTPYLADLKVGEMMVSGIGPNAPYGYLQKVTKITTAGGQVTVETQAATLDEALIEGEFSEEGKLGAKQLSSMSLRQGVVPVGFDKNAIASQGNSFKFDINTVLYDDDGNNSTTSDQIRLKGNFELVVDDGLSYSLKWKKVLGVPVYPKGIYVRMAYGFNQNASVRVEAEFARSIEKEVELAKYTFDPITFFIGPVPVVLIPSVRITADLKGNITAKMTFGASESVVAQAGFEYNDGFKNITQFSKSFNKYAEIEGAKGTLEAGLNLQGEILLYGLVGPYARVRGNITMDAAVPRDPVWTLSAGVQGHVGIHADLLVKTLNYDAQIFKETFEFARSENQKPTVSFKSPKEGQEYSQNVKVENICLLMDDLESSDLQVSISSSLDGNLLSKSVIRGNFSSTCVPPYAFKTLGNRTLTVTVTDKGGLTATATRTINIVNNPPSVLILQPTNTTKIYKNGPTLLRGALMDPNENLDCKAFKWSSSNPADNKNMPADPCGDAMVTFETEGTRTITLEARDSQNMPGSVQVTINVLPEPVNHPPVVSIEQPKMGVDGSGNPVLPSLPPLDQTMTLKGTLLDKEKASLSYSWVLSYQPRGKGVTSTTLHSNAVPAGSLTQHVEYTFDPSDLLPIAGGTEFKCYDVEPHNIFLRLEVSDGVNSTVVASIQLQKGCF
ncbi:DUF5011 domain-containing protein [Deinococcus cellulosilyticus]|uniref:Uncharacterized protein n=1 Tax=Deinococcus cellulosilyticus (strain DSM 18568 / NBRC 106333 / KACC 11606 / 5516J-15) TaxID=1223518 RepID=A0A511N0V7_DEIC1|nr:DUF5011 domain-containing protein [Deinococcus cellulosilyticus]GEM46510.1 hypothetical protein DC3_21450 [Deinococcus cellulosilyticus NBRC 106333 = KACC 11606]